MTPYKIMTLFRIHKSFNPDKFKQEKERLQGQGGIDEALGGF